MQPLAHASAVQRPLATALGSAPSPMMSHACAPLRGALAGGSLLQQRGRHSASILASRDRRALPHGLRAASSATAPPGRTGSNATPPQLPPELEAQLPTHCSGCGVELQNQDPDLPGWYQVPLKLVERLTATGQDAEEVTLAGAAPVGARDDAGVEPATQGRAAGGPGKFGDFRDDETTTITIKGGIAELDAELEFDDDELEFDDDELDDDFLQDDALDVLESKKGPRGPTSTEIPADVDMSIDEQLALFDSIVDGWDDAPLRRNEDLRVDPHEHGEEGIRLLCARCHSLTHYGKIKSEAAESILPSFDLGRKVGRKIALQKDRRAVVLCVVDVADFDGSLPRAALRELIPDELWEWDARNETREQRARRHDPSSALARVRLVLVANKVDLLPKTATEARLKQWVRSRAKAGGLPKPAAIHLVSSTKGTGIQTVMRDLQKQVGLRGDVWVVGAQNAGKSSLINAMKRVAGTADRKNPTITEAPLPGTTLGVLRVDGLPLPPKSRCFDTPGVPHLYQLSARLRPEEVRMLLPERKLRPRTYRIGAGQTLQLGGLASIDVTECPSHTLYLTVWASDRIALHCGRTENSRDTWKRHAGTKLTPPVGGPERAEELSEFIETSITVRGDDWQRSTTDIHIAGLGWVAVGVSGEAAFNVHAHPGIAITTHAALLPDYAREFERPGWSNALPAAPTSTAGGKKKKKKGGKRS